MPHEGECPGKGKWCNDIGAHEGAPNEDWGVRDAEGHRPGG